MIQGHLSVFAPPLRKKRTLTNLQSFAYPALTVQPQNPGEISLRLYVNQTQAEKAHLQGVKQLSIIHLSKEVKHLKRSLKIPVKWHPATSLLGGSSTIERQMVDKILTDSLAKNIRTKKSFDTCIKMNGPKLYHMGQDLLGIVTPILSAFLETHNRLTNGLSRHLGNRPITEFINRRQSDLVRTEMACIYNGKRVSRSLV